MHNFGGGRSDLFNSGGRWSKGGGEGIFSKFRGELAKRGDKKFRGVWTLDEAMIFGQILRCNPHINVCRF